MFTWSLLVATMVLDASHHAGDPVTPSVVHAAQASDKSAGVQEILTKFEKNHQPSAKGAAAKQNWNLRMECLVKLMKIGPEAVPVLIECLKNEKKPAHTRALSALALGFLADDRARPVLLQAIEDKDGGVQADADKALGRLGRLSGTPKLQKLLADRDRESGSFFNLKFILTRDDQPNPEPIRQALRNYDLARIDSADLGKLAPDFTLADTSGKTWHLAQFRGKKAVVLICLIDIN
jgi:HEAT repeats